MLHRDVAFPHETEIPVLGVPTRFRCGDRTLLDQVERAFGSWRSVADRREVLADRGPTVCLSLHEDVSSDRGAPVRYRLAPHGRLVVATAGSQGVADQTRDEGFLWVTPTLVSDDAHFRFAVLSAVTLFLVTAHDRRPVHAGAIASRGAALLLHGPSGSGKSTLALACARAGLTVLAEDAVYAQVEDAFRLWGYPGPLHLTRDALAFFPGLPPSEAVIRGHGPAKVAVPLPDAAVDPFPVRDRAGICLVRRSVGTPRVEPADPSEVREAVARPDEPGFDVFRGRMDEVARRLADGGAWVLHVGSDPTAAVALVSDLLRSVERGAPD